MHSNLVTGKCVANLFFTRDTIDSNIFYADVALEESVAGRAIKTRYRMSKLLTRIMSKSYRWGHDFTQRQMDTFSATNKSKNLFGWMDFIVNGLLPFHFVEDKEIRKHVKHDPRILIHS